MRPTGLVAAAAPALLASASASIYDSIDEVAALVARALPANAPHGYTPQTVRCPAATPTIRSAERLSPNETRWLEVRRKATLEPMKDLLRRVNISGFDTDAYMNKHQQDASALPTIGIAMSGGGYRAMLNGAGVIQAFDNRSANSTSPGHLGGLLQAATYLSGLSGGSWLVSTLYANNNTSVDRIISSAADSGNLWQLDNTILQGPDSGGVQLFDSGGYYNALLDQVSRKEDAGFNTTLTDYWGRALSYQLINATDGGPEYTFSSIAQQDWFQQGEVPLPLLVTNNRAPGKTLVSTKSTVVEISPWELGSHDPTLYAFAPLKYVGTNFTNGSPQDDDRCVVGFDNVGYVFGTSSSLFNAILVTFTQNNASNLLTAAVKTALTAVLEEIGQDNEDIADWVNPFLGYKNSTNLNSQVETLTLVDGGEDGQNIPLHPLIQPNRKVDIIFAVDSSADTNETFPTQDSAPGWPDGISIITTYQRSKSDIGNGTLFPEVPSLNTFMNLGLNAKPVFFGCDASQFDGPAPLVVYMPNAPYVYTSNTSTFQMGYNNTQRDAVILNAYNMATQGNGTLDAQWPACVGCAILSRSFNRTGTDVPEVCTQCFSRYCWNGTVDDSTPGTYAPAYYLKDKAIKLTSGAGKRTSSAILGAVMLGFSLL